MPNMIIAAEVNSVDIAILDAYDYHFTKDEHGVYTIQLGDCILGELIQKPESILKVQMDGNGFQRDMKVSATSSQHLLITQTSMEINITTYLGGSETVELEIVYRFNELQFPQAIQHTKEWQKEHDRLCAALDDITNIIAPAEKSILSRQKLAMIIEALDTQNDQFFNVLPYDELREEMQALLDASTI